MLPAELRRDLAVDSGDALVIEHRPGALRIRSAREVAAAGRGMFASAGDGRALVDELLAERRHEARREAKDAGGTR